MAIALILAAGTGERLGGAHPKALVELAGQPMLQWSLDVFAAIEAIERIVIALPSAVKAHEAEEDEHGVLAKERGAVAGPVESRGETPLPAGIRLPSAALTVPGGVVRSESVRLALAAAGPGGPVLIHDAARPLLTPEIVLATLRALEGDDGLDGAVAAAPVADTIKQAGADGRVLRTLDRSGLWAVQTPQVFRREALERALQVPAEVLAAATDDAWLVERAGGRVEIVPAPASNLKVTTPLDLDVAERLLARRHA